MVTEAIHGNLSPITRILGGNGISALPCRLTIDAQLKRGWLLNWYFARHGSF